MLKSCRKILAIGVLFFSNVLNSMEAETLLEVYQQEEQSLTQALQEIYLKKDIHKVYLIIHDSEIDRGSFELLVKILQQYKKINKLQIGPHCWQGTCNWYTEKYEGPKFKYDITLSTLKIFDTSLESDFFRASEQYLFPRLTKVNELIVNKMSLTCFLMTKFIENFIGNKNELGSIDISDNNLAIDEISIVLNSIMDYKISNIKKLNLSSNAKECKGTQASQRISSCWRVNFAHRFGQELTQLNMSKMNLGDRFVAMLIWQIKAGHFPRLEHLAVGGIREQEPVLTAGELLDFDIKASALPRLSFDNIYLDKFISCNTSLGEAQQAQENRCVIITGAQIDEESLSDIIKLTMALNITDLKIIDCVLKIQPEEFINLLEKINLEVLELKGRDTEVLVLLIDKLKISGNLASIKHFKR